jgi:hypothetical protein
MKTLLLKTIYKTLLSTLPLLTYNSFTKLFYAPFTIKPYSTYINFRLEEDQIFYLQNYIKQYTDSIELFPIKMFPMDVPSYILSVNIYNCTSPLFSNEEKDITRCEINTYVKDKNNNYGTLILDYCSNYLSLDPVDLFKKEQKAFFTKNYSFLNYNIFNDKLNFSIQFDYTNTNKIKRIISDSLVQFTDNIFYKNGICDKLFYDSTLVKSVIESPVDYRNFTFMYKHMKFDNIHSIFYFKNKLHFICGLWHNLYNNLYTLDL